MTLDEVKALIKTLSVDDRRKVALYIIELEKDHFQDTIVPQINDDLESVSKVIQDAVERIKKRVKENL